METLAAVRAELENEVKPECIKGVQFSESTFGYAFYDSLTVWDRKHPGIILMLQDKDRSCEEIMDAFIKCHQLPSGVDITDKPFHNLEIEMNRNLLLCLSVIYNRMDILNHNQKHLSGLSNFLVNDGLSLLVLAAYYENLELIRMLFAAGFLVEQKSYFIIGNLRNSQAIDAAIMKDNVEIMEILRVVSGADCMTLLYETIDFKAEKCFQVLLANVDLNDKDLNIHNCYPLGVNASMLKILIKHGYRDIHKYGVDGDTLMHFAVSKIDFNREPQCYLDIIHCLGLLGVKTCTFNKKGQLPIDIIINSTNNMADTALTIVSKLLSSMEAERPQQDFLLPCNTINNIQRTFCSQIKSAWMSRRKNQCKLNNWVNLLQECLSKGVNLSNDDQQLYLAEGIQAVQSEYEYNLFTCPYYDCFPPRSFRQSDQLVESMIRFYTWLIVYGAKLDARCFDFLATLLEFPVFNDMRRFVECCISLMSAQDIQAFQGYVAKQNLKNNRNIDISPVSYGFCKTLKDMCRSTLYDNIRHGRMIVHVGSLPLPQDMKNYLVFDCKLED